MISHCEYYTSQYVGTANSAPNGIAWTSLRRHAPCIGQVRSDRISHPAGATVARDRATCMTDLLFQKLSEKCLTRLFECPIAAKDIPSSARDGLSFTRSIFAPHFIPLRLAKSRLMSEVTRQARLFTAHSSRPVVPRNRQASSGRRAGFLSHACDVKAGDLIFRSSHAVFSLNLSPLPYLLYPPTFFPPFSFLQSFCTHHHISDLPRSFLFPKKLIHFNPDHLRDRHNSVRAIHTTPKTSAARPEARALPTIRANTVST